MPYLNIKYLRGLSFMLSLLVRLPSLVADFHPDIIHAHSYQPATATVLAKWLFHIRVPLVMTAHGTVAVATVAQRSALYRGLVGSVIRFFEEFSIRHADQIIAVDHEIEHQALNIRGGDGVVYITNGVDIDRFRPGHDLSIRHQLGIPDHDLVILTARRLDGKNNVVTLARAFDILCRWRRDIWLIVIGDGEQRQDIEKLGNPRIRLVGWVDNNRITDYLHAADLFVMPSLYEATSISCLEAMACGLPIVVTRVGGLPDLVDGNGLLCEPTASSLSSTIRTALGSDLSAMGKRSREIAEERFSWTSVAAQHKRVYEQALV